MIVHKSRYEFLISTLKKTQWDEKVPALLQPSEWQSNSFKGCVAFHNRIFVTNCPRKISMHAFALLFTITSSLLSVQSHHPYHHHHHHQHHHEYNHHYQQAVSQRSISISRVLCSYQDCKQPYLIFLLKISSLIKLQKLSEWNWKGFTAAPLLLQICEIAIRGRWWYYWEFTTFSPNPDNPSWSSCPSRQINWTPRV